MYIHVHVDSVSGFVYVGHAPRPPSVFRREGYIAMADRSRAHHGAFLKHLKDLETVITDPGGLGTSLYSKGLIDNLAWQKATNSSSTVLERSRELLQKLEGKIDEDESALDTFLAILDRDPTKKVEA